MKDIALLIEALAGFAWPALIAFVIYYYRTNAVQLTKAIVEQVRLGATVKYGQIELVGKKITDFPLVGDGNIYEREAADQKIFDRRESVYNSTKKLFLVHRYKKTDRVSDNGQKYYDLSVFIISHKNYGRLNDVKYVEYYFGEYFGKVDFPQYGAKYIVRNSIDGFAIRTQAYGPSLCEARIVFHDGSNAVIYRYLDFEGSGYRYEEDVDK